MRNERERERRKRMSMGTRSGESGPDRVGMLNADDRLLTLQPTP